MISYYGRVGIMCTSNDDINNNRRGGILASSMASVLRPPPVECRFLWHYPQTKIKWGGGFLEGKKASQIKLLVFVEKMVMMVSRYCGINMGSPIH